jgi:hypothetical protein
MANGGKIYTTELRVQQTQTIAEFAEQNFIAIKRESAQSDGIDLKDLFEGNRELIFVQMSSKQKLSFYEQFGKIPQSAADLDINMKIPAGTLIITLAKYVNKLTAIEQTNIQVDEEKFSVFNYEAIQNIIYNPSYLPAGMGSKFSPSVSVFGWFKTFYTITQYDGVAVKGINKEHPGFFNLSPFIMAVNTNVGDNGGNFAITLPIIDMGSRLKDYFGNNPDGTIDYSMFITSQSSIFTKLKRSEVDGTMIPKVRLETADNNFFSKAISNNDLIFISFEKLEMEDRKDNWSDYLDGKVVNSRAFDMIGLVDSVSFNVDANGNGSVVVNGRDLMKLLIDDGSFFFNFSQTNGASEIFLNLGEASHRRGDWIDVDQQHTATPDPANRLRRISTEIDALVNRPDIDIDTILKAVLSQLANIEVVPSAVFADWENKTTYSHLVPKPKQDNKQ